MRICDDLRQAVLQAAIQGKLTKQLWDKNSVEAVLRNILNEKKQLNFENKIMPSRKSNDVNLDIPDSWMLVPLQNLVLSSISYGIIKLGAEDSQGVKVIRCSDVKEGFVIRNTIRTVTKKLSDQYSRTILQKDDIVINVRGTLGGCAIIPQEMSGYNIAREVALIRCASCISRKYIMYLLLSPYFKVFMTGNLKGIAYKGLNMEKLREFPVPLPSQEEQHRIVARVEELMARIDDLEKTETELEKLKAAFPGDMKAALLQAAMQGKLTEQLPEDGDAADLINQIAAEKAKLIKEGKIKKEKPLPEITTDEVPFDIPDNWKWVRLRNACTDIFSGKSPIYSKIATNYRIIGQAANQQVGIDLTQIKYTNADFWNSMNERYFIRKNDVLLNTLGNGTLGRSGIIKELPYPLLTDGHLFVFRMVDTISSKFLYYYMQLKRSDIEKTANGSTNQTFLSLSNTVNWIIPVPPLAEQKRIVEKLDKLLPLCDGLVEE